MERCCRRPEEGRFTSELYGLVLPQIFPIPIFTEIFYAVLRESYFYLLLSLRLSLFSTRMLAGKNGVIAGHGAGYMERHYMDG
jgi:hypothetical protein